MNEISVIAYYACMSVCVYVCFKLYAFVDIFRFYVRIQLPLISHTDAVPQKETDILERRNIVGNVCMADYLGAMGSLLFVHLPRDL